MLKILNIENKKSLEEEIKEKEIKIKEDIEKKDKIMRSEGYIHFSKILEIINSVSINKEEKNKIIKQFLKEERK